MTTLLAWVSYTPTGTDPDTPRALYLASDSRISWGSANIRWDAGRKVFAPLTKPHLFGYCGDVVFPALVLGQIVDAINLGVMDVDEANADRLAEEIRETIRRSFAQHRNPPARDFTIVHGYRVGQGADTRFMVSCLSYSATGRQWSHGCEEVPNETGVVLELGSGARVAGRFRKTWANSDVGGTSRAIFSAFCDALKSGDDGFTGGPPQVAALFNAGAPVNLGFVDARRLFLHGLEVDQGRNVRGSLEWRDMLFQRTNPKTFRPMDGARRFARPVGLPKT